MIYSTSPLWSGYNKILSAIRTVYCVQLRQLITVIYKNGKKLFYFKGTVSRDFDLFYFTQKTLHGPLIIKHNDFAKFFDFPKIFCTNAVHVVFLVSG